eukprot:CAMPEP_0119286142 /NCGR_PEP_ID=MMETSP1329-20130426/33393_1 /TAXON_ID=114041 /ORGANISM="Genus nov. species nov., Strain RCC1024" /LENGTH=171 /DNA_ID=CAMNT_0007286873 /DNA_START=56 /DNA_END=567 /DNA_ORIENTATION=+
MAEESKGGGGDTPEAISAFEESLRKAFSGGGSTVHLQAAELQDWASIKGAFSKVLAEAERASGDKGGFTGPGIQTRAEFEAAQAKQGQGGGRPRANSDGALPTTSEDAPYIPAENLPTTDDGTPILGLGEAPPGKPKRDEAWEEEVQARLKRERADFPTETETEEEEWARL